MPSPAGALLSSPWPGLTRPPTTVRLVAALTSVYRGITRKISRAVTIAKGGWVYIMTNRVNGTLYVGTTTDLARRAWEHRNGVADSFTKRYGLDRLVYAERHDDILQAKQRERNIKHWRRAWKIQLILKENPNWDDLYDCLV